jgi:hypothetical protein
MSRINRKYDFETVGKAIEDMVCNNFNTTDIKNKYGMSIQMASYFMTKHWFYKKEGVTLTLKSKV